MASPGATSHWTPGRGVRIIRDIYRGAEQASHRSTPQSGQLAACTTVDEGCHHVMNHGLRKGCALSHLHGPSLGKLGEAAVVGGVDVDRAEVVGVLAHVLLAGRFCHVS
eukprot:COSAG01_NODE_699_length_14176_cov_21.100590_14_plen_109_part_00